MLVGDTTKLYLSVVSISTQPCFFPCKQSKPFEKDVLSQIMVNKKFSKRKSVYSHCNFLEPLSVLQQLALLVLSASSWAHPLSIYECEVGIEGGR